MFPIIFHLGPFTLYTFNIFVLIGALGAAFLFWRRAHAEHFEDDEVFDVLIVSSVMALIVSRVVYIALHLSTLMMDVGGWIEAVSKPGFDEITAIVVGFWYVWFLSKRKKWDTFELVDSAAIGTSFLLVFVWIGRFFAGTFLGDVTSLPIGITFPNVFDSRHPSQLYFALAFFLVYILLLFLEKRYRFFEWYRAGKHTANSGFIVAVFLVCYGAGHLGLSFVDLQQTVVMGVRLDLFFYIIMVCYGLSLIFLRSGQNKLSKKKWHGPGGSKKEGKRRRLFGR